MLKKGDKVRRIGHDCNGCIVDQIYTVAKIIDYRVFLEGFHDKQFSDCFFIKVNDVMFEVKDLETGMRIQYANGEVGIVIKDLEVIIFKESWIKLQDAFNNGLPDKWKAEKVFSRPIGINRLLNFDYVGNLLWDSKDQEIIKLENEVKELQAKIDRLKNS